MRIVSLLAVLLVASPAVAHPLPNLRFDRVVHVRVGGAGVTVKYALEVNDWTMAIDGNRVLKPEDVAGLTGAQAYAKKYAARKAPLLADDLRATLDGTGLVFRVQKVEVEPDRDHLRLHFQFYAEFPAGSAGGAFAFADQNFEDQAGQITLTLDASHPDIDLTDVTEPSDLRGKASVDYKPGDELRSRKLSATISRPTVAVAPPTVDAPVTVEASGPRTLAEDLRERGVAAVFDHDLGFGLLLLLCVVFGAAHAFTPGHGKTMVAAYLVGERGTILHAVVLGITTTLTHTGSVILVAGLFLAAYGDAPPALAQAWLALVGGLLITGVGFWLFVQRLSGRADHVHLFTDAPAAARRQGWWRVVLLGIGGGIVPCYDAVLIFLLAANRGRLAASLPMLLAFSAGLAAVLVALGVGVVLAGRAGGRRFAERRWFRYLPVVSAFVLTALGLWFLRDAWQSLAAAQAAP